MVVASQCARYDLSRDPVPGASIVEVPISAELDFAMDRAEARTVFDRGRNSAGNQLAELAKPPSQLHRMG
jgi:hypothetical protein